MCPQRAGGRDASAQPVTRAALFVRRIVARPGCREAGSSFTVNAAFETTRSRSQQQRDPGRLYRAISRSFA
jgi:hypothetical protein